VVSSGFQICRTVSTVSLRVWAKAVKTAAWVAQGMVITGLKPRCEWKRPHCTSTD